MRQLEKHEYHYKRLVKKYPYSSIFYSKYYSGDYYNKACTDYYDKNKKLLETEYHDYYG